MKKVLALLFMGVSFTAFAQDYYLTKERNKQPLKVASVQDINKLLKEQGKADKYKPVILTQNASEALFLLVPASLNVRKEEEGFLVSNYDIEANAEDVKDGFDINIALRDEAEDIKARIAEYSLESGEDVKPLFSKKMYGRIMYEVCTFDMGELSSIVLTAPFNGKFIELNYMTPRKTKKDLLEGKKVDAGNKKGEAALGIAASSLTKALFGKNAAQGGKISADVDDLQSGRQERPAPELSDWMVKKLSPRNLQASFNINEGEEVYSYVIVLPEESSPKPQDEKEGRITIKEEADAIMWLEPVYKNSKNFNDEMTDKYAPEKNFTQNPGRKIKRGGKDISFVKKTALNVNSYSYFFNEGGRKFVLSFIAPSSKLKDYEILSGEVLNGFKSVKRF